MKKILLLLTVFILLFSSCENLLQTPDLIKNDNPIPTDGKALVSINILNNGASASRTVLPDKDEIEDEIFYYKLFGSISGTETELASFSDTSAPITVELAPGTWNFTLEAYDLLDDVILQGKILNKQIVNSGSNTVDFVLMPIDSDVGIYYFEIKVPALSQINRYEYFIDGNPSFNSVLSSTKIASDSGKKPAGEYFFSFHFYTDNKLRAVVSERFIIKGNVFSRFEYELSMADINPLDTAERYVKAGGTGDGLTWATASSDLQKMIDEAHYEWRLGASKAIVHVAEGTYKPQYAPNSDGTTYYGYNNNPDRTFIMRKGVEIRGGYDTNGVYLLPEIYPTILSGDFNGDDDGNAVIGFTDMTENAHHVVFAFGIPPEYPAIIDGFTIKGGNADGSGSISVAGNNIERNNGGGVYLRNSSVIINNVVIENNITSGNGGGVYFNGGAVTIGSKTVIKDNLKGTAKNNFYSYTGNYITLGTAAQAPASGMEVWVQTADTDGVIVQNGASTEHAAFFKADEAGKTVVYNSGQLKIANVVAGTTGLSFTPINGGNEYSVAMGTATDTVIVIPAEYEGKTVKEIAENSFRSANITSITIPNSVTSIGNSAFSNCSRLASITIPNSVTSIGQGAFSGCSSLTSITIPNSVTTIGSQAFYYCTGLTSITIPDSVTSIAYAAFAGCSSLASITIANSVTSITDNAFEGCTSLTNITIPNKVTSIGNYAFNGCTNLTSVTFEGPISSDFNAEAFPGDLRAKYLLGGVGTYTRTAGSDTWTR